MGALREVVKEHLEFVHKGADSFITVATKKDGDFKSHYHYKGVDEAYLAVIEKSQDNVDIYTSHANFSNPKRGKATLWHINTLFADLDCHTDGESFDLDALVYFLETDFFGVTLPKPSEMVFTGRGVQLYWKIEEAPRQVLPLWELVESRILQELDTITEYIPTLSVDMACKDVTRITRTPGTTNTKSGTQAYVVFRNDEIYRLHDIIEGYFPDLHITEERREEIKEQKAEKKKKKKAKAVKVNKKIVKIFNSYTLSYQRSSDLTKLLELRDGDVKGYRDEFLYIYIWTVIEKHSTLEDVERELDALNSLFKRPMSDSKIRTKAKHVYNKFQSQVLKKARKGDRAEHRYFYYDRYVFRNETIIKRLNITEEEQREMTTIISKEEKYRRNNEKRREKRRNENGLTKKQQEKLDRYATIQELKRLGYTQKAVSESLNIGIATVKRHWN